MAEVSQTGTSSSSPDVVARSFNTLISAFDRVADDIKLQCAEASMNGDVEEAEALLNETRRVLATRRDAIRLLNDWLQKETSHKRAPTTRPCPKPKGTGSRLRVTIAGKTIEHPTTSATFSESIRRIGADRVATLNLTLSKIPLLTREQVNGYQQQSQIPGWYVTTHSNTATKKAMLDEIASKLGVQMLVKIV